ncbi:MAG: chorismate--pyruvate lyase [Oscillospiraceae bacterium]|nr:chorismate--pyruvate lyase [Oscillospiraceae bacterium]
MEPHDYIVVDIRGDYAFLRQTDAENTELFQVAAALLPPETDIGTRLHGMMGMFEIVP